MRKYLWPVVLMVAGCAAPPQTPPVAAPSPALSPAHRAGPSEVWEIVGSRIEVRVYRDGPMARLGHNHLVSSTAITGRIDLRTPRTASEFSLKLPLESLIVDDETARAAAGGDFAAPVPERDRDGTRRNMLGGQVLDAARQPVIDLTADSIAGGPEHYTAAVRLRLRGSEHRIQVPVTLAQGGDRLQLHAKLTLRHADLGLVPFTAALGALRVRDEFEIDCRLEARRAT